nr:hypothetical protein [Tanacetum cinerariifolium]
MTQVTNNLKNGNGNGNGGGNNGCTYKGFVACGPRDFDKTGGVVALTRWIEKMESVIDNSECLANQKTDCKTTLTNLKTKFENAFNSEFKKQDLKGTRIEHGFTWAFMSLFGQDADTFTSTMLLKVDLLQKQLEKDEFQEDGSMTAFLGVNNQFQKFIDSHVTLDYDSQMTDKYFVKYTGIEVKHFRDTLLQNMGNVKNSVFERVRHQRQYDRRVNKRLMKTQESKIDTGKAINNDLVVTKSSGTESEVQDDNSRKGNDTDADDADIIPIYDEEPMAKVQLTVKCNIFAIGQQHTEQPEIISEEQTTSFLANNAALKAQIQEKVFAIDALKNYLKKLKGNSVDTKFANTSVLGKPIVQPLRNQSVVRQPNAFKNERPQMSKQRFAFQVDGNHSLSKPVTQHYLPKKLESAFAKPDHMIASSSSRNSSKNMPRFS